MSYTPSSGLAPSAWAAGDVAASAPGSAVEGEKGELLGAEIARTLAALRSVLSEEHCQRCKLSAARLRRPKLLFLLRIVRAITEQTGFGAGLYSDERGQQAVLSITEPGAFPSKDAVRQAKLEYFHRLQHAVVGALGESHLPANTRSVIMGAEPLLTNVLLQKLCSAATLSPRSSGPAGVTVPGLGASSTLSHPAVASSALAPASAPPPQLPPLQHRSLHAAEPLWPPKFRSAGTAPAAALDSGNVGGGGGGGGEAAVTHHRQRTVAAATHGLTGVPSDPHDRYEACLSVCQLLGVVERR
jgi:hypothetical protein